MHLRFTLLSSFLFTAAALAHLLEYGPLAHAKRVADTSYKAGAALTRGNNTFASVNSTIFIPQFSGDLGSGVALWNSIDGQECSGTSLMAGIFLLVNEDGTTTCKPFHQWYPEDMHLYEDFTVSQGDTIELDVIATSATTGTIIIRDGDDSRVQHITSTSELCQSDAQWVLAALNEGGNGFETLTNFGEATFQYATATGLDGQSYAPQDNPTVFDIVQDGKKVTSTQVEGSFVTINYAG